jgi:hypothetical protein
MSSRGKKKKINKEKHEKTMEILNKYIEHGGKIKDLFKTN